MKYIIIVLHSVFFCMKPTIIYSLSCSEIVQLPEERRLTLGELSTIAPNEIVDCLPHLGRDKLAVEEADFIWKAIVKFYNGAMNIPVNVMMLLHWVTPALQPEDYANITLSNIDVITNFGFNYNLSQAQLTAIADRVREDFADKEPEDFTYYDLTALRQILCAFNKSEIERIQPSAYREAAIVIGKLEECPVEVIQGFAALAVHRLAFGNPSQWSDDVIKTVGVVANHVGATKTMAHTD